MATMPMTRMRIDVVYERGGLQYVDGTGAAGERLKGVLWLDTHGHATSPPIGAVGIVQAMGGNRDQMIVTGAEMPGKRPVGIGAGETVLYNAHGQAISIITNEVRIVGGAKITLTAGEIILDGTVRLGGAGAARALALKDSADEAGHKAVGNLASKVFGL
jgi:phage gp45-like